MDWAEHIIYLFKFYFMCLDVLPVWLSVYYICVGSVVTRRELDPLGLELKMVMSCYVGAGS